MRLFFDQKADILYLTLGKNNKAISKELGNDVLVRVDPKSKKIVGCTVLNFTARFKKRKRPIYLPITGDFKLKKN